MSPAPWSAPPRLRPGPLHCCPPDCTLHSCPFPIHSLPIYQSGISLNAGLLMSTYPGCHGSCNEDQHLNMVGSILSHNALSFHLSTLATLIFCQFLKSATIIQMQGLDMCCFLWPNSRLYSKVYQHKPMFPMCLKYHFLLKLFLTSHSGSAL